MDPDAPALRDIDRGDCALYGYGCAWRGNQYVCCCNRNYCNTAISNYKFNFYILFLSSFFILFTKFFFY